MKIVIPGGSGQVGTVLARAFHADGHEVVVLSRSPVFSRSPVGASWRSVSWDARTLGGWTDELEGADVVINLAGRSVNCRYNAANRAQIIDSRVDSTRAIGQAISNCASPPRTWLQASTATIYAHSIDHSNDEAGALGGNEPNAPDTWKFSIDVVRRWERALDEADTPRTRKVKLRSAMVMSPDRGGVFDVLLRLVRFGLGGRSGKGNQYISWIHHRDFIRAIYFLLERSDLDGAVNVSSPNPLPNTNFMRALRQAWGIPFGLPASEWMLEIGAFGLRTETELVLKSRRVVPGRLLAEGFAFEFPTWREAADDLCDDWRRAGLADE